MSLSIRIAFVFTVLSICNNVGFAKKKASADKVDVAVYYESLCPDSRNFFNDQLKPAFDKLGSRFNLEMIPYGNAQVIGDPGTWSFTCQHGPDECYGNIVQTCAINLMNSTKDSLDFILCAFKFRKQQDIIMQCEKSKDMQEKLDNCAEGSDGKNLEFKMATKTDSLNPPQTFIPWITINGKGSQDLNREANRDFIQLLCNHFEIDIPASCEKHRRRRRDSFRRLDGL